MYRVALSTQRAIIVMGFSLWCAGSALTLLRVEQRLGTTIKGLTLSNVN